jgi:hypothetical protein
VDDRSPVRVGSRYEQVARFLGKEVRTKFEVTAFELGRLIAISSLPGSSPQHRPRLDHVVSSSRRHATSLLN